MRGLAVAVTVAVAIVSGLITLRAQVERRTIPEALAQSGRSLRGMWTVPSGVPPTMDRILAETQMIVRGVVGNPTTYLSADQRDIFSDYPIIKPAVLVDRDVVSTPAPGLPQVTVTIPGGVFVNPSGLTYTLKPEALPQLEPGTEALFLLKRADKQLHLVGTFYGAFQITDGRLQPLIQKEGFAKEYRGALASVVAEEWRTIVQSKAVNETKK